MAKKGKGNRRVKGRDYFSVLLVVGIVLLLGIISFFLFKSAFEKEAPPKPPEKIAKKPPERVPPPPPVPTVPEYKASLAIVIDDMGGSLDIARIIAAIDPNITFAVMPNEAKSAAVVREMSDRGHDVIMHLPMEPKDLARNNPGKGALLVAMNADDIRKTIEEDLKKVPGVKGVNNHMGSRFTEERDDMKVVLGELKKRQLFFLDSRTTGKSVAKDVAKEVGIKSASRDVFLDNTVDEAHSRRQLQKAAELALKKGQAIIIGHPHPSSIKVLREMVPQLREKGIRIIGVSQLTG